MSRDFWEEKNMGVWRFAKPWRTTNFRNLQKWFGGLSLVVETHIYVLNPIVLECVHHNSIESKTSESGPVLHYVDPDRPVKVDYLVKPVVTQQGWQLDNLTASQLSWETNIFRMCASISISIY